MSNPNIATYRYALKNLFPPSKVINLAARDRPFLGMVKKKTNAGGDLIKCPVRYANSTGRSANIGTAIANKNKHKGVAFFLERRSDYGAVDIDRETMLASVGNAAAFLENKKAETEGIINSVADSLARSLYLGASGAIGQIGTLVGSTITLADPNQIENFEKDMPLEASADKTGGSVRAGVATVTSLNRDAGTITFSGTITGLAASDFLFAQGDYGDKVAGLDDWIPENAPPSNDSFFTVNRSVDPSLLAGNRVDGTGLAVKDALRKGAMVSGRRRGKPDCAFINDAQMDKLLSELDNDAQRVRFGGEAGVFYEGVRIFTPKGSMEVYTDPLIAGNVAYVLQMNTWELFSLGDCPQVFDDGTDQEYLRGATSDDYELRVGYYAQLGCHAPGFNSRVALDAVTY